MVGDMNGAKEYGSKALCLTSFALGLAIICFIIIIVRGVITIDKKNSAVTCDVLVNHICESIKDRLSLAKALTTVVYLIMLKHI